MILFRHHFRRMGRNTPWPGTYLANGSTGTIASFFTGSTRSPLSHRTAHTIHIHFISRRPPGPGPLWVFGFYYALFMSEIDNKIKTKTTSKRLIKFYLLSQARPLFNIVRYELYECSAGGDFWSARIKISPVMIIGYITARC